MIEQTIQVDRIEDVISVFGSFDQNLRLIESEYGVHVTDRDAKIHITGEPEAVMEAQKALNGLLQLAAKGEEITEQNVRYIFQLVREGREQKITEQNVRYIFQLVREGREQKIGELAGDVVCITAKGKPIKAKTIGQRSYLDAIEQNTITLGIGPAGTGKTYLAVAEAVAAFRAEKVNRIILTRPAVEAGERLGFLPGDLQSKVDPYLRPLYDALFEMLGAETYQKYLERGNIEVAPLAYMRGRTLDDSFIILDEAQNTSREQMKMFLTRIGFGSHVVITGDVTQIDLPPDKTSGLKEAMRAFSTGLTTLPSAVSRRRTSCATPSCRKSSRPMTAPRTRKSPRKKRARPKSPPPKSRPGGRKHEPFSRIHPQPRRPRLPAHESAGASRN